MSLLASGFLAVQQASPRPAVPIDPVVAIADPSASQRSDWTVDATLD